LLDLLGRGRQLYRELVALAVEEGFQLTEEALRVLQRRENPVDDLLKTIAMLKEQSPDAVVIGVADIERACMEQAHAVPPPPEDNPPQQTTCTAVMSIDESYRIEGSIAEFQQYFLSRYHGIRRILEKRRLNFIPAAELYALRDGEEAQFVGILQSRQEYGGGLRLELDDPSGNITVYVSKKNSQLYTQASELLNDVVVGLRVRRVGNILSLKDIMYPDVEENSQQTYPPAHVSICLISDVHVGSKHFCRDLFEKFLDWLNRGRDGEVKRVRYLVIDGDLVEGVGVYPRQERDLVYRNVEEQMREAGKLLEEVPEHVEVFYIPGNHEPVRRAIPQPPLQERYRGFFASRQRINFTSNPTSLVVDGRSLLIYHGQGLDEVIQSMPDISYSSLQTTATKVVTALLKFRHLAPVYGGNTQLLPTHEDKLVIYEKPYLLQTGHIHVTVNTVYHGVKLVNTGAWQDQTEYQKAAGLEPVVGYAALVDLGKNSVVFKYFGG
jgi:DNA polymerase II small subunit